MLARKFESLEEIRAEPGYVAQIRNVDKDAPKFIGYYMFKERIQCAREECSQWHGFGYVVRTASDATIAIGNVCGTALFGDIWAAARSSFNKIIAAQNLEASLAAQLEELPELLRTINEVIAAKRGAVWLERAELSLRRLCSKRVQWRLDSKVQSRSSEVTIARLRNSNDPPARKGESQYIDERVGSFVGLLGLSTPTPAIILRDQLKPEIETFLDVTSATLMGNPKLRRRFQDFYSGIVGKMKTAEQRLLEATVFFETNNLRLISYLAQNDGERTPLSRLVWNEEKGLVEQG